MPGPLSGPGVGLPYPQSLYPVNLTGGELIPSGNAITLAPAQMLPIPRGRFWINLNGYAVLQWFDPVLAAWRNISSARMSGMVVDSDGFNLRVGNLTGCAVGAIVTNGGSAYVQSSTTVLPSAGSSVWQPIVGGRMNTTVSITATGAGYGLPPLVVVSPPPSPGVQASAIAVLNTGSVSSITVINAGAGYTSAPVLSIYPNPTDPNALSNSITAAATATVALAGSGVLSAIICTNPGASFTTVPSLTITGAGTSAAATIVPMWALTGASITSGGAGYSANVELSTIGGLPSGTPAFTNPALEQTGYIPRKASALMTCTGGTITTVNTIYDGGLFVGTPTAQVISALASPTTPATIAISLSSVNATVEIQPLG